MICHVSLPAKNPAKAAAALAKVIDGEAMKYPVVKGAYIVIANDGSGMGIELWPETTTQTPGTGMMITEQDPDFAKWNGLKTWDYELQYDTKPVSSSPIHIAVSTKLSVDEVLEVGREQNWRAVYTNRVVFNLVELWLDNQVLIECIPGEEELVRYRSFTQPALARELFGRMPEH